MDQSEPEDATPKLGRYQFGLRSMLLAVTGVAAILGTTRWAGLSVLYLAAILAALARLIQGVRRRNRRIVVEGIVLLLLAVELAWVGPPTHTERTTKFRCTNCGMHRTLREEGPVKSLQSTESLDDTPRSEWHRKHFGGGCKHAWEQWGQWQADYVSILGLHMPGSVSAGHRRGLPELNREALADAETLFHADPVECRRRFEQALTSNSAAWQSKPFSMP
jgi:hypothetical protein